MRSVALVSAALAAASEGALAWRTEGSRSGTVSKSCHIQENLRAKRRAQDDVPGELQKYAI